VRGVGDAAVEGQRTMSRFSIMFVCTGNLCRSPMAERLAVAALRRRLGPRADLFRIHSAGTHAVSGWPMTTEAAAVVAAYGADPAGFVSTELTADLIAEADLVLTATRAHRSQVVTLEPSALRRVFTMTEFARVAREVGFAQICREVEESVPAQDLVERAHAVVAIVARRRGTVRPTRPDEDDIADPIGQPMAVYQSIGDVIARAVDASITALVGRC
jgi:protein-tyrosine phosphatase